LDEKNKIYKRNILARYARFYQNILLAILIGIVWSIYAILEKKTNETNEDIMILSAIGFIIAILITLKIRTIDYQQDELFRKAWKGRIMETIFAYALLAGVVGIILYNLSLSTHKPHK